MIISKGSNVKVYSHPITLDDLEGEATVVKVLKPLAWADAAGNPMYRAKINFNGDDVDAIYERDVSVAI